MSGDEVLVTLASVVLGPAAWVFWLFRMSGLQRRSRPSTTEALALALITSAMLIFLVLRTVASFDVVDDIRYQFMYLMLGLAWLRLAQWGLAFAGLSARDDAIERGNQAVTIALFGALIGLALCYAGGNIGNGPGWWVVVFSAALATGAFLVVLALLMSVTSLSDAITMDRDRAAGLRLAGFLVALGALLGRGVAGDWHSGLQTLLDFGAALPSVALMLAAAIVVERISRPTPDRPYGSLLVSGLLPSLIYLAVAVTGVGLLGWPA